MTFTSNLSFLLDGIDWLQERIMSTDLPLPPAAAASSDIIVHEVRCKMYSHSVSDVQVRSCYYHYCLSQYEYDDD